MTFRTLGFALALSLLLHVLVIASPGWHLPEEGEGDAVLLEAMLTAKPQATPPATPLPKPKPKPKRRPKTATSPPAGLVQTQIPDNNKMPIASGAVTTAPAENPAPVVPPPAAETAAAEIALPRQGRISFSVRYGGNDFEVGRALHAWQQDGKHYQLQNVTQTSGLVAIFRSLKVTQSSQGEIGAAGLRPHEFRVEQKTGKESNEVVRFDWQQMRATFASGSGTPREETFIAGALDLLALVYQFAVVPPGGQKMELMITAGKNFRRHAIEVAGEEKLTTPLGELRTLHLRSAETAGNPANIQRTEFWLALEFHYLPVRIRHVDRKGDIFDQVAVEMELDGTRITEKR